MKNFKINKNQTPLTEADIAQGKDFGKLVKAYQAAKVPLYKSARFWIGASSMLVAGVAILVVLNKIYGGSDTNHPFIAPPIASADIKRTTYIIDAQKDSTIIYPSGSKIHVPANAFLDKNGKPVKGKVELNYREFNKAADVFVAGIPMTYDSAGEQFHFETAGMMEIAASQNGEELKTNPTALLQVDMVSANREDQFNTYYLDTVAKKWKYVAQNNFKAPASKEPLISTGANLQLKNIEKEIAALEKLKPGKPKKQDNGKPRFSIKVDPAEFPEIAVYKGVKFQVEDANYKPEKADITWADIELKRLPGGNRYQITFINPDEKYQLIAVPVFGDKDYAAATEVYNKKFEAYQSALAQKKANEIALEAAAKAKEQTDSIESKRVDASWANAHLIYRSFTVSDFGYWNSDHPCSLPAGNAQVVLNLIDSKTKQTVKAQLCYLVEKDRNVLFAYGASGLSRFRFDPTKNNGLWIMTNDSHLAVARYGDFKNAEKKNNQLNVEVTFIDKNLKTSNEVRKYLEM